MWADVVQDRNPPKTVPPPSLDLPRIATEVWDAKYRFKRPDGTPIDATMADTFRRVADAAARAEKASVRRHWADRFLEAMADLTFLPAGRILAGAGTHRSVTLFNCFVMGRVPDDLAGIFDSVKEAALTMQQGGGIGQDFSTLRPKGALVRSIGADASGPVVFMDVWDSMCLTIMSAGARRGAMMATMRCDHPDIESFVEAKRNPERLRNFNLSVLVTDAFIRAVRDDADWDLVFEGRVFRTVRARALWERIMRATYDVAEPGVIFIDRVNALNNLSYCEDIHATNPCGEQPLPPYGACLLGSINLARLVIDPFGAKPRLDEDALAARTRLAVRFLDDVIDVSGYPLAAQRREAKAKRRLGLGVTGLADALAQIGLRYDSPAALAAADRWMATIKANAYTASAELAAEKGSFPLYERDAFLSRPGVESLPNEIRQAIARTGIRNGLLTSVAPTGTISLLAGNVSSGIEPVFDLAYARRVLERDGSHRTEHVEDYAYRVFRQLHGETAPLPGALITAAAVTPRSHLEMQAAVQKHVDSSISKTINCPEDISFEAFHDVYLEAYELGLKGVTTFRPNPVTGSVLTSSPPIPDAGTADRRPERRTETNSATPAASEPRRTMLPARGNGGDVVYMAKPLEREPALAGYTYKLKWPGSDHAMYITINDIEHDGRRRPFEIFINSKNLEHYAWTLALTRMISAVFRRGGDVSFVVEELKAVFDPQGGRWMEGRYVPSLLAAIGEVIETHLRRTGVIDGEPPLDLGVTNESHRLPSPATAAADASTPSDPGRPRAAHSASPRQEGGKGSQPAGSGARARGCPRCGMTSFVKEGGCWTCRSCGHSTCG